jgi:hypothetical protein
MHNWCICWFFTHILTKCTVEEAKSLVKKSCQAELCGGIYSGVKGLGITNAVYYGMLTIHQSNAPFPVTTQQFRMMCDKDILQHFLCRSKPS